MYFQLGAQICDTSHILIHLCFEQIVEPCHRRRVVHKLWHVNICFDGHTPVQKQMIPTLTPKPTSVELL